MAVTWVGSCWFVGCGGVGEVKEVEKVEKLKEEVRGFCCVQPERRQGVIYIYMFFSQRRGTIGPADCGRAEFWPALNTGA